MNNNISISEQWDNFIAGDDKAYSNLYEEQVQSLYQYGLCFTLDGDLIKDCIQDLFVYLYSNRNHLHKLRNVNVYLLTSLKHNLLRKINVINGYSLDDNEVNFLSELSVEEEYIEQEANNNEKRKVKKILSLLTSRQKEVMYYRFVQELSMKEICELMDMNYQSVQNLIQRALKKIRSEYGDGFLLYCIVNPTIILYL